MKFGHYLSTNIWILSSHVVSFLSFAGWNEVASPSVEMLPVDWWFTFVIWYKQCATDSLHQYLVIYYSWNHCAVMKVFQTGPEFRILAWKIILKVTGFGETCSDMHVLGVYGVHSGFSVKFPDFDPYNTFITVYVFLFTAGSEEWTIYFAHFLVIMVHCHWPFHTMYQFLGVYQI